MTWLRSLFRALPRRVQGSVYHRLLAGKGARFSPLYAGAPLLLAPGMRMDLNPTDSFHGEIAWRGLYEDELSQRLRRLAETPGGLLVDVGANYGYFTLLWCAARADNAAVCIEAAPANQRALQANLQRNALTGRVRLETWAAAQAEGQVSFDLGPDRETGWGGISRSAGDFLIQVPAHRLDQALAGRDISVLKIDCEGADAWVIEGAAGLLAEKRIAHLFFEENRPRQQALGIDAGRAQQLLADQGYACEPLGHDPMLQGYHAWPRV